MISEEVTVPQEGGVTPSLILGGRLSLFIENFVNLIKIPDPVKGCDWKTDCGLFFKNPDRGGNRGTPAMRQPALLQPPSLPLSFILTNPYTTT